MEKQSDLSNPELFFKDRYNNIYPYLKEDIKDEVDPLKPITFMKFLKDMWIILGLKKSGIIQ